MSAKDPERIKPHIESDNWDEHLAEWCWVKHHWYIYVSALALGILLAYWVWG